MDLLNLCREWRLLHNFKSSLVGKLARYKPDRGAVCTPGPSSAFFLDNNLAFIQAELHMVFQWGFQNAKLSQDTFDVLEHHLVTVCQLLETAVNQSLISNAAGPAKKSYPNLRMLLAYVNTTSEKLSLVNGPHPALFMIQSGNDAPEMLGALGRLNKLMMEICKDPKTSLQPGAYASELPERPRTPFRDHVESVLKTLFRHFNCDVDHEVLLPLPGVTVSEKLPRTLELFLSRCTARDCWHEVHRVPYE